ncbi:glycosyltransferase family 2 protein [Mixia osmundae IAM 14324]|uniref:glycosyltransferase family 2 protein n=1 Tax=Mixia osmundae (strain CBS 9802 / IAM 14324 / JCM 22182 / KY 12970) TaxID=764103 RepID=UPI0004A54B23|nr:glycosyltransferase family 2 protein [Mixia osmundae IAM 14324]KEI39934.1 glycosyltransferase family 2 protein [Mixia osmundae IAM 14324]
MVLQWFTPRPRAMTARERTFCSIHTTRKRSPSGSRLVKSTSFTETREERQPFESSLADPATLSLSVIVPAYNEAKRIQQMLQEALDYLESPPQRRRHSRGYEVIVVDDGSTDSTCAVVLEYAAKRQDSGGKTIRVVQLDRNRGKGGAVTHGMKFARGKRLLFVDADGASQFEDLDLLDKEMDRIEKEGYGLVLGSRAHMVKTPAVRSALRNILMRCFHAYLHIMGISTVKDTQCGFKLLTRPTASIVFTNMHVEGWIFDIELILIATFIDAPTSEVAIRWKEVDGSKMQLARDSIAMALDLLVIRANYSLGRWPLPTREQPQLDSLEPKPKAA